MGAMAVLFISMTIDMMNHQNPSIVSKVEANPNPEVQVNKCFLEILIFA
jgi:hypothetical protein